MLKEEGAPVDYMLAVFKSTIEGLLGGSQGMGP